ncbi:MAG: DUF4430 domain-containing protein [Candidatus Saccharimonadales bacterium]
MKKNTVLSKNIILSVISALILFGVGIGAGILTQITINPDNTAGTISVTPITMTNGSNNVSKIGFEFSYKGEDSKTALELLQKTATIKTSGTGENAYVTTISNVAANSKNEYWQFFVNGKSSMIGAGSYTTKSTDTITWKLSSF